MTHQNVLVFVRTSPLGSGPLPSSPARQTEPGCGGLAVGALLTLSRSPSLPWGNRERLAGIPDMEDFGTGEELRKGSDANNLSLGGDPGKHADMQNPPVPTDSLYKFAALGGLAGLLFVFWSLEERIHAHRLEVQKCACEVAIMALDQALETPGMTEEMIGAQNLAASMLSLVQQQERLKEQGKETNSLSQSQIVQRTENIRKAALELENRRLESIKRFKGKLDISKENLHKITELEYKALSLTEAEHDLLSLRTEVKWAYVLLGLMTVGGFCFWYRKVQMYQDRILRKEAEETSPSPGNGNHPESTFKI